MEFHELYCSACDRQVRVVYPGPRRESDGGSEIDATGICFDYCSNACTGTLCSLFDQPPEEMRERLKQSTDSADTRIERFCSPSN